MGKEPKGMEGFAVLSDLKAEAYQEGAFYLGNLHPEHGDNFPVGIHDDRHILGEIAESW